jgi:hypothetical protein
VILASPGFMSSGPSRELLELWAPDAKNGVIITGYSIEGTMARVSAVLVYFSSSSRALLVVGAQQWKHSDLSCMDSMMQCNIIFSLFGVFPTCRCAVECLQVVKILFEALGT